MLPTGNNYRSRARGTFGRCSKIMIRDYMCDVVDTCTYVADI